MAVKEGVSGAIEEVDSRFDAGRTSLWPVEAEAWVALAVQSGALTGLSADDPVLSFRNISANPVLVRRVSLGFLTTTQFATPQVMDFGLYVARAFTESDSGGTQVALTGDNGSLDSGLSMLTSADLRISDTSALTPGTRTLDANPIGRLIGWSADEGISIPQQSIFEAPPGSQPLVLGQDEGFVVACKEAMGAAGVGTLFMVVELVEVGSFG